MKNWNKDDKHSLFIVDFDKSLKCIGNDVCVCVRDVVTEAQKRDIHQERRGERRRARNRTTLHFRSRNQPLLLLDFPANCVSTGLTVCSPDCAFMHTVTGTAHPLARHHRFCSWVLRAALSTFGENSLPSLPRHKWLPQYIYTMLRQFEHVNFIVFTARWYILLILLILHLLIYPTQLLILLVISFILISINAMFQSASNVINKSCYRYFQFASCYNAFYLIEINEIQHQSLSSRLLLPLFRFRIRMPGVSLCSFSFFVNSNSVYRGTHDTGLN